LGRAFRQPVLARIIEPTSKLDSPEHRVHRARVRQLRGI